MRNMVFAAGLGASLTALGAYWIASRQPPRPGVVEASDPEAEEPAAVPERRTLPAVALAHSLPREAERRQGAPERVEAPPNVLPPRIPATGFGADPYPKILDASFERESIDASWAKETESKMYGALATLPGVRVVGARCKATMCRFEIAYETSAAAETFRTDYVQLEPFSNTTAYEERLTGPDGRVTGHIIHFARQGRTLPATATESQN